MGTIIDVFGREILDSRGNPTVEVEVVLDDMQQVVPLFLPVHPPVLLKQWSFAMAIPSVTWARAR